MHDNKISKLVMKSQLEKAQFFYSRVSLNLKT